jgi:hypothetical protein
MSRAGRGVLLDRDEMRIPGCRLATTVANTNLRLALATSLCVQARTGSVL